MTPTTPAVLTAVSFDVDGTLHDFDAVMRRALGKVLEALTEADPVAAGMLTIDRMIEIRDTVHDERKGEGWNLQEVRREGFRRMLEVAGRPDEALAARLGDVYFETRYSVGALFDDVRPVLEALATRLTLGIISNGNTYPSQLGLEDLITFAVYSEHHGGIDKPDPRIFRTALEEAGCEPRQMVHVGDDLVGDVAGAQNAGIRAVWLNRDGRRKSASIEPDWKMTSLAELDNTLANI
jgi:FMN hydrolase / 5-amino-6-(5-phospho-D-ribitylamino)uracil phosphatase